MEAQNFDLLALAGNPEVAPSEYISNETVKSYGPLDEKAILEQCGFLKWAWQNPTLPEPAWYAAMVLVTRFKNPQQAAIDMSKGYPKFSEKEALLKAEHAKGSPGPWTCEKIRQVWPEPKCQDCAFNGKVKTPLQIRAPEFIKTRDSGFHTVIYDLKGIPKGEPRPCYLDLLKFFSEQHPYLSTTDGRTYIYQENFWQEIEEPFILNFAQEYFNPKPDIKKCNEFLKLVRRTNLKRPAWFHSSTNKKINLKNGVLDCETMKMSEHDMEYGFRTLIDYDYQSDVVADKFLKFLDEITLGREEFKEVLLQFMGYAISNDDYWEHKALLLTGNTRNGKSVFVNILKMLVGEGYYSCSPLQEIKDKHNRTSLENKLFNICEETSSSDYVRNPILKILVSGGVVTFRYLYGKTFELKNKTKFIMTANEPPDIQESVAAMTRRLCIVPFDADFKGKEDKFLLDKIKPERAAILRLALEAYQRMKANQGITMGEELTNNLLEMEEASDYFGRFVRENVAFGDKDHNKTLNSDLYLRYKFCCERDELPPMHNDLFFKTLFQRFPSFRERRGTAASGKTRILNGVYLVGNGAEGTMEGMI